MIAIDAGDIGFECDYVAQLVPSDMSRVKFAALDLKRTGSREVMLANRSATGTF